MLDSVTASARAGEVLAIAGASGAGKSTLLDAMAGNIRYASLKVRKSWSVEVGMRRAFPGKRTQH